MNKENRKNNKIVNLGQPVTAGMDVGLEKAGEKLVEALKPFLAMLKNDHGTDHARALILFQFFNTSINLGDI